MPNNMCAVKFDDSVMRLAKEVGEKLHRYNDQEIDRIAEWLVHGGVNTGHPVGWIAAQYRAGHFAAAIAA